MILSSWILSFIWWFGIQQETQEVDENFERNNLLLQSWTPTVEEKLQLKLQGQSWKQGVWSKEEIEQLKQNILEYCGVIFFKNTSALILTKMIF